jgi:hypothetical protein
MQEIIKITQPLLLDSHRTLGYVDAKSLRILSVALNGDSIEIFAAVSEHHSIRYDDSPISVKYILATEGSIIPFDSYLCFPVQGMPGAIFIQYDERKNQ